MLSLIGLGVDFSLTERARVALEKAQKAYVESYTSWLPPDDELRRIIAKDFVRADREIIEMKGDELIAEGKKMDIAVLFPGDPLCATTHVDLMLRARHAGVVVEVFHNSSIFTAISRTGLQLYKFGKTASIPFPAPGFAPETPYDIFLGNQGIGAHTLVLLDMNPSQDLYVSPNMAIAYMVALGRRKKDSTFTAKTLCLGCARLGMEGEEIVYGSVEQVGKHDFSKPPFCLIVPGKLHFTEEEMLDAYRI